MKQRLTVPLVLALIIVLFGGFLRLFRLESTLMFQGDQGRDALVVKRMIVDRDFTLLGPVTSVGNMYLGPFYYYFMLPFMLFTYPNPIGPAIGVALVGTLTIFLVYLAAKEMFGERAGLISALLYAVLYDAIIYSRFSWNPNIAPLFGLLIFWYMFRFLKFRNYKFLIAAIGLFGILIQLHYIALLMAAVIGAGMVWAAWRFREWRKLLLATLAGTIIFAALQLPLVIFDLRHNGLISNGFKEFFISREDTLEPAGGLPRILEELEGKTHRVIAQGIESPHGTIDRIITVAVLIFLIVLFVRDKKLRRNVGFSLLLVWIVSAIAGTSFYRGSVFDHYLSYLYPSLALFYGFLFERISRSTAGKGLTIILIGIFCYFNFSKPIFGSPGSVFTRYRVAAAEISPKIEVPYNIVLLSETGDYKGMNYRYFLETSPVAPQNAENYANLQSLFVIDEVNTPNPLEMPIYEIQSTGLTIVSEPVTIFPGVRVFKLTRED